MSATTLGIPLNFGLYYGFKNDNTISLLLNAMPETCMFRYINTTKLNNMEELEQYDTSSLLTGHTIYITDSDSESKGLQTCQYMWDAKLSKWIAFGNPLIQHVLNIYALYPDENEDTLSTQYFMRVHLRNIQSNIRLMSLLNGNYMISNLELMSFLSLTGEYDLNNSQTNNILSNILSINLSYGIATLLKRLCLKYNVPYKDFSEFQNTIATCTDKVLFESKELFGQIVLKYYNIDLSMYTNYIAAAFAAFKTIVISFYNNESSVPALDILSSLKDNDSYLLNRLNANKEMYNSFYALGEVLDYYLYQINDVDEWNTRYNFLIKLKEVITYFMLSNTDIIQNIDIRNSLIIDLCEGIGGIVNLALLFSIISNSGTSSTTLYFHFIAPKKYDTVY